MNGYKKRSMSSSSDEDLQSVLDRNNVKEDLFSCQIVSCEFCDEAFLNRYNYLVHTASHIIIPLQRQTFFRCQECHQQCRTERKLRKHMKKKHPHARLHRKKKHRDSDTKESQVINNNENSNNNEKSNCYEITNNNEEYIIPDVESKITEQTKVKEFDLPKHDSILPKQNSILRQLLINEKSNQGVLEIIEIESDDEVVDIKDINCQDIERERIKDRLIFEDDDMDDIIKSIADDDTIDIIKPNGLINDLVSDIKVSVNLEPWMSSITDDGETAAEQERMSKEWRRKTVSYQELKKTKEVRCRYCDKTFPNRLTLIKHEPTHIANKKLLRRPFLCQFCDWYVSCEPQALKKHHKTMHPGKELRPMQSIAKTCGRCHLKYISEEKHMKNYHHIDYKQPDVKDTDIFSHRGLHFHKRLIQVCDLCASFFKNVKNSLYYRSVGEKSVIGERQKCDRCLKQFFSVNLVEVSSRMQERKKKPLSNADRLKNIQNRLKMINKIRKYLQAFYFTYLIPLNEQFIYIYLHVYTFMSVISETDPTISLKFGIWGFSGVNNRTRFSFHAEYGR